MNKLFWDLETTGLPEADIAKLMPEFEAPGNIKDPVKIAAAIADNRASQWSEFDFSLLRDELLTLDTGDFEMENLTGFTASELESLAVWTPDEASPMMKVSSGKVLTCPHCGKEIRKQDLPA